MKFSLAFALLVGVFLSLLAEGCTGKVFSSLSEPTVTPTATVTATPAPLNLTILSTNDTWGYLLPCG